MANTMTSDPKLPGEPLKTISSVTKTAVLWCGALGYGVQSHVPNPIRTSAFRADCGRDVGL